ncbi:unnamed protein product [Rotaria sp. Silwood2]|nr:unnamed protein product [Rotaria sp. Silwood2]
MQKFSSKTFQVVVECPSIGIKQTFPCNNWLADDEGDRHIERRLKEDLSLRKTRPPTVPWYIWVYTSDKKGAGTNGQVILVLYGNYGKSINIKLEKNSDTLQQGHCNQYKVDMNDVGIPFKLRVSLNNKSLSHSWHLDRIEMTNLKTNEQYRFLCGRWLSKIEDEKQIIRELPAEGPGISRSLPIIKYIVDVYTGNKPNAGTDANVFINIYGECGDTGVRPLEYSLQNKNKFERNQVDSFIIEAVLLKQIQKIRIGHDGTGTASKWFLNKVVIRSEDQRYGPVTFICDRWFAIYEDDGQIVRELTPTKDLQETTYNVKIKTGDIFQAGTHADVHLQIFGDKAETDKIQLKTINNSINTFERGRIDSFTFQCHNLGKIGHIRIGHNGTSYDAGWFLDWIEIHVPSHREIYRFVCHRWLDTKEGDGRIELDLKPTDIIKTHIPYEITVCTGDKVGAGTDAKVFIQIYGLYGKTEEIILENKFNSFERNSVDKFIIEAADVGKIEKIRIGHYSEKLSSGWYLEKVLIQRYSSEPFDKRNRISTPHVEEYLFICRQWFDKSQSDRKTVREFLPTNENGHMLINRKVNYLVQVFTGDKSGAGTDANVFLTIYGDKGYTSEHELVHSQTYKNKFERKQIDKFIIESDDLGYIYKIKIRHDNSGVLDDWFLEKIEVRGDDKQTYLFYCEQWLAKNKGDSNIERILYEKNYKGLMSNREVVARPTEECIPYIVKIKTGEASDAGTSANVSIRLIGSKGRQTRMIQLEVMQRRRFEPGKIETFSLEEPDIGDVEMVEIEHNGDTLADSWFLDGVIVETPTKGRTFYFICNEWLSKYKGDRRTKRILRVQDLNKASCRPLIPYFVRIYTGHIEHAGSQCDVSLKLFGTIGSSSEHIIRKHEGSFERSAIDVFQCELEDVGKPIKLRVKLLPKSIKDRNQWYLEKIELIKHAKQNLREETYSFELNDWIGHQTDCYLDIPITKGNRVSMHRTNYRVITKTSDMDDANCDANVFIIISGENGESEQLELKYSSTHINKFERNHEDVFTFENILSLGQLNKLLIWHDDSSILKSSWHLEYVQIEDLQTGQIYVFPCNKWLSSTKDDRQIVRELFSSNHPYFGSQYDSLTSDGQVLYQIEVVTSDKQNAGTTQDGWIIIEGNKKKSDKLFMKNTLHKNILRRGQIDMFTFECQPLGELRRIILGHEEQHEYLFKTYEGDQTLWHVSLISITDLSTGIIYEFPVQQWIAINNDGYVFDCVNKKEHSVVQEYTRRTINYKFIFHTGYVSGVNTDANVSIILYGTLGNTGNILLKQSGQNLFERGGVDEFIIEWLELGKLTKLHIEYQNSMSLSDWFLDKVDVINVDTNETVVFPWKQSLGKKHDGHHIQRDLLPIYTS